MVNTWRKTLGNTEDKRDEKVGFEVTTKCHYRICDYDK